MKKVVYFLAPLMCVSTLVGCKTDDPEPTKFYSVTFLSEGSQYGEVQEVEENKTAVKPKDPTKDYDDTYKYEFREWQLEGEGFDFNTPITQDITLTADFTPVERAMFTVKFDVNGGKESYDDQPVKEFECAHSPGNPTKEHDDENKFVFNEWQLDGVAFDFNTPITKSITLVADYTSVPRETFTVEFDLLGGKGDVPSQLILEYGYATKPEVEITKDSTVDKDFKFSFWSTSSADEGATEFKFETTQITSNLTLYAHYTESVRKYSVKFINCGEQYGDIQEVEYNKTATKPNNPTNPDVEHTYEFNCWKDEDGNEFKFSTPIDKDYVLTAEYSIADQCDIVVTAEGWSGATVTGGGTYVYGTEVTVTASAFPETLPGYFDGWFEGDKKVCSSLSYSFKVEGSRNLVAKYQETVYINIKVEDPHEFDFTPQSAYYDIGLTTFSAYLTADAAYYGYITHWIVDGKEYIGNTVDIEVTHDTKNILIIAMQQ